MAHYIATLHVLIEADSEAHACDAISEWLREGYDAAAFKDWGYCTTQKPIPSEIMESVAATGQSYFTHPVPIEVPANYEEGDFYSFLPETHKIG